MEQSMGNILAGLITYKADDIDKYIHEMRSDLNIKTSLNYKIETKVKADEANIRCITNFIERNDTTIEQQVKDIKQITEGLKNAHLFSNELAERNKACIEIIKSEKCVNVRQRLAEIKRLRKDIHDFLEKGGIQAS